MSLSSFDDNMYIYNDEIEIVAYGQTNVFSKMT